MELRNPLVFIHVLVTRYKNILSEKVSGILDLKAMVV